MKVNNKKGFTLAELLIVVAIIGVLIAIAMPTFSKELTRAKVAADQANLRAAYSEAVADYLTKNDGTQPDPSTVELKSGKTAPADLQGDLPFTLAGTGQTTGNTEITWSNFGDETKTITGTMGAP